MTTPCDDTRNALIRAAFAAALRRFDATTAPDCEPVKETEHG